MKNLLITGLTGKSGLVFAKELSRSDILKQYKIFSCVRPSSNVQTIQNILPDITFIVGDLNDDEYLKMATKGIDILFHIAGIHYSLALVKAAVSNHVRRIILVHTTGIYSKYKAAGEEYRRVENDIERLRGVLR